MHGRGAGHSCGCRAALIHVALRLLLGTLKTLETGHNTEPPGVGNSGSFQTLSFATWAYMHLLFI